MLKTLSSNPETPSHQKGRKPRHKPWEDKIKKTQLEVRESYSNAIKMLSASPVKEDKKLAKELKGYLDTMAKELVTQNHEMKKKIYDDIAASRKDQKVKDNEVNKKDMDR